MPYPLVIGLWTKAHIEALTEAFRLENNRIIVTIISLHVTKWEQERERVGAGGGGGEIYRRKESQNARARIYWGWREREIDKQKIEYEAERASGDKYASSLRTSLRDVH